MKTPELNRLVEKISLEHPPASPGRRHVRILYATQTAVAPPTFVFFTNVATSFHFSYTRYLENRLREEFGFEGTPLRMHVRARRKEATPKEGKQKGKGKTKGKRKTKGRGKRRRGAPRAASVSFVAAPPAVVARNAGRPLAK